MERGARIATAALTLVGCTPAAFVRQGEGPGAPGYYGTISSCAITVLKAWALAGCTDERATTPYYPKRIGKAFADMFGIAEDVGAVTYGVKSPPLGLLAGDAFVIAADARGTDPHVGTCVEDQANGDIGAPLETVEGGQGRGPDVGRFTRHFVRDPASGLLMMGHRRLFAIIRAACLPVPDDAVAT